MHNRFWRIERRPHGTDFAGALALVEADLPELADMLKGLTQT